MYAVEGDWFCRDLPSLLPEKGEDSTESREICLPSRILASVAIASKPLAGERANVVGMIRMWKGTVFSAIFSPDGCMRSWSHRRDSLVIQQYEERLRLTGGLCCRYVCRWCEPFCGGWTALGHTSNYPSKRSKTRFWCFGGDIPR